MSKKRKPSPQRRSASNGDAKAADSSGSSSAAKAKAKVRPVPTGAGVGVLPSTLRALAIGFRSVLGEPLLVVLPLVLVGLVWTILLAVGMRFLPPVMVNLLSVPPPGSLFDISIGAALLGFTGTMLLWLLAFTAMRAVVTAVMVGLLDEVATHGRASMVGVFRGLQAFGAVMIFEYFALTVALLSTILLPSFGSSLGNIMNILIPVGTMYLLSMAPFVAVRQRDGEGPAARRIGGPEAVRRAAKGARLPGWPRFLTLIVSYYFIMAIVVPIFQPGRDQVTAAPSFGTWIWVFAAAVINVAFFGAIGAYWRAAEPYVAPLAPKSSSAPVRSRGRGST